MATLGSAGRMRWLVFVGIAFVVAIVGDLVLIYTVGS